MMNLVNLNDVRNCHIGDDGEYERWNIDPDAIIKSYKEIIQCYKCKYASGDTRICEKFGHSPIGELDFCAWGEINE